MDQIVYRRVVVPNECFPRRRYFQRRILSIAERMGRILDYEFKSPHLLPMEQDTSLQARRESILLMTQTVSGNHPEIHMIGDNSLIDYDFTKQLVVRKECMSTTVNQEVLKPEAESLCALCVVAVECSNDMQKFETNLRLILDKVTSEEVADKTSTFLTPNHGMQHVVIAIRSDHYIANTALEDLHATVQKVVREFSIHINFDVHKQTVLLPAKLTHSSPVSNVRPLFSGEPRAKQRAVTASWSIRDIQPHPTKSSVLPQSVSTQRSSLSSPRGSTSITMTGTSSALASDRVTTRSMTRPTTLHVLNQAHTDDHVSVQSITTGSTSSPNPKTVQEQENAPCEFTIYQAVSYQFETKLIDNIVVAIESLLVDVKCRRDFNAGQPLFTVLDKLLFEVRGLYNQSITRTAIEKQTKADTQRMAPELANKLLMLDHVKGCGHIYGKITVHIDDEVDEEKKAAVIKQIQEVIEQNTTLRAPHDYEINMVNGQTTLFGRTF